MADGTFATCTDGDSCPARPHPPAVLRRHGRAPQRRAANTLTGHASSRAWRLLAGPARPEAAQLRTRALAGGAGVHTGWEGSRAPARRPPGRLSVTGALPPGFSWAEWQKGPGTEPRAAAENANVLCKGTSTRSGGRRPAPEGPCGRSPHRGPPLLPGAREGRGAGQHMASSLRPSLLLSILGTAGIPGLSQTGRMRESRREVPAWSTQGGSRSHYSAC